MPVLARYLRCANPEKAPRGSTFEGLLHARVIAALKAPAYPRYGVDADHIQVNRGPGGLDRTREVVEAAKGSAFAVECPKEFDGDPAPRPGRRDSGGFAIREQLYDLTPGFLAEYGAA